MANYYNVIEVIGDAWSLFVFLASNLHTEFGYEFYSYKRIYNIDNCCQKIT